MVAAGHAGVRIVPVNWHWTAEELAYVLADSGSSVLIADDRYADAAVDGVAALAEPLAAAVLMRDDPPAGFVSLEEWLAAAPADEPDDQRYGGRCSTRRAPPASPRA